MPSQLITHCVTSADSQCNQAQNNRKYQQNWAIQRRVRVTAIWRL